MTAASCDAGFCGLPSGVSCALCSTAQPCPRCGQTTSPMCGEVCVGCRYEATIVTHCPPLFDRSYTGRYLRDRPEDGGFVLEIAGEEVTFGPEYRDQLGLSAS